VLTKYHGSPPIVSENLDDADKKGFMIMTKNPDDNKTS